MGIFLLKTHLISFNFIFCKIELSVGLNFLFFFANKVINFLWYLNFQLTDKLLTTIYWSNSPISLFLFLLILCASDTMYYPLRGSVTVWSSNHGWRSPDGIVYPRLPKYYPYRGSAPYGSIGCDRGCAHI